MQFFSKNGPEKWENHGFCEIFETSAKKQVENWPYFPFSDQGRLIDTQESMYSPCIEFAIVQENGFSVKMTLKIEKFEKRAADLKSARKNAFKNGPAFYFRTWEGKKTPNCTDLMSR